MVRILLVLVAICAITSSILAAPPSKTAKGTAKNRKTTGAADQSDKQAAAGDSQANPIEPVNPGVFLLRDPLVQAELKISSEQMATAAELAAEFNDSIWRFRDAVIESDVAQREARLINAQIEPRLRDLLDARQRDRLVGLTLQTQGTNALSFTSTVQKLSLSSDQQQKIAKRSSSAQAAIKKRKEQAASNGDPAELNRQIGKQQADLQRDLQNILTKSQRERWAELTGTPIDLGKLRPLTAQAPELRGVATWINSEPLRLQDLRGKVVAVHFWTFNCINCIHNYPSYKFWDDKFSREDLVIVGVHTPETEGEKNVDTIRQKAKQNGLNFPIAVDNEQKNWQAWSNTIWPAVYLVDKRGFVRNWWYGELNWQGTAGEQYFRGKIRELMAEK